MKALNTLPDKEILKAIYSSQELSETLREYIQDTEIYWLDEKLNCFKSGIDYSIGFYNHNYFHVVGYNGFLEGVYKSIRSFGATEKLEKLYYQCEKLRGTNLFDYKINQLAKLYFEEELQSIIKHVEDVTYQIHCKDMNLDFDLECFAYNRLEGIYVNDKGELLSIKRYD